MGRKSKYTKELKHKICEEFLHEGQSIGRITRVYGLDKKTVYSWARAYSKGGIDVFDEKKHNASYSKEFKECVVKEHLQTGISITQLAIKYGIPGIETVRQWIMRYNNHKELVDYDPHAEVYMAERLKTTPEERLEIVTYCLEHDRDYKSTAVHFGASYSQVYEWVRKYLKDGESGLNDRRGIHKTEEDLTDIEKANRRIAKLERENEIQRREIELLKKAKALERTS